MKPSLSKARQEPDIAAGQFGLSNEQVVERVGVEQIKLPRSVRKIGPRAIALCKANLQRFGQPGPILVSETLDLVHGEEMLLAAKELGWSAINVVRIRNLSDGDRRVLTLALAKLPLLSSWDEDALRVEFTEIVALDLDYEIEDLTGFSTTEIDLVINPVAAEPKADPLDRLPDPFPHGETVSRRGDLWHLGSHLLHCADALEPDSYERLMGEQKAGMVFTDPPYNVPIAGHVSGLGRVKHQDFAMAVGEMSSDHFTGFLARFLENSAASSSDGALVYVFMDRRHLLEVQLAARTAGLQTVDLCIWDKMSGGMGSFYRSQHEPVFVFRAGQAPHRNNVELGRHGRYRTNVWQYRGLASFGRGRGEMLALHPTVKPVALIVDAIKDCTRRGEIVLDPFAGSGSTIVAAHKAGRTGYGIELDPQYADTVVRRWQKVAGESATLDETGATFDEVRAQRQSNPQPAFTPAFTAETEPTKEIPNG